MGSHQPADRDVGPLIRRRRGGSYQQTPGAFAAYLIPLGARDDPDLQQANLVGFGHRTEATDSRAVQASGCVSGARARRRIDGGTRVRRRDRSGRGTIHREVRTLDPCHATQAVDVALIHILAESSPSASLRGPPSCSTFSAPRSTTWELRPRTKGQQPMHVSLVNSGTPLTDPLKVPRTSFAPLVFPTSVAVSPLSVLPVHRSGAQGRGLREV